MILSWNDPKLRGDELNELFLPSEELSAQLNEERRPAGVASYDCHLRQTPPDVFLT